jgi:hypothetical protein
MPYMSAAPTPDEKVLDFDSALAVADAFVGRETVFAALETFRTNATAATDIVAEAGTGKQLAAAIARRRDAICFSRREPRPSVPISSDPRQRSAPRHTSQYERLPENIGNDATFFTKVLRQAVATLPPGSALWLVVDDWTRLNHQRMRRTAAPADGCQNRRTSWLRAGPGPISGLPTRPSSVNDSSRRR